MESDLIRRADALPVPACYGCIETEILRSGACLHCAHVEGCKQFAANIKKSLEEILRKGKR